MPMAPMASNPSDAGSGTLDVGKDNPLAAAKASKAATSPAEAAPLTPWLKFAANTLKSDAFTRPS
jgi:hypothetical protein